MNLQESGVGDKQAYQDWKAPKREVRPPAKIDRVPEELGPEDLPTEETEKPQNEEDRAQAERDRAYYEGVQAFHFFAKGDEMNAKAERDAYWAEKDAEKRQSLKGRLRWLYWRVMHGVDIDKQ